jgi:hypothetical protein
MAYSKQLFARLNLRRAPANRKNHCGDRAALDAGSRSRSYWCDSLILSRLAEAALAAGDPASAGAALQEAFAFVEQSGEQSGSPTCIGSMATSRSNGRSRIGRRRKRAS